ncbi:MAG: plasmid mobilization protein [Butyricicoccus sp.]
MEISSYCVSRMDKSAIYALRSAVLQITILRALCCIVFLRSELCSWQIRDQSSSFRVSEEEWELLQQKIAESGMNQQQYIFVLRV